MRSQTVASYYSMYCLFIDAAAYTKEAIAHNVVLSPLQITRIPKPPFRLEYIDYSAH